MNVCAIPGTVTRVPHAKRSLNRRVNLRLLEKKRRRRNKQKRKRKELS